VVRTARVQEERVPPGHEMRACFAHVCRVGVFLDQAVGKVRVDERVAYAHKVKIRGDEDEDAEPALGRLRQARYRGQDGAVEVFEPRIRIRHVRGRFEAQECLLDAVRERLDQSRCVIGLMLESRLRDLILAFTSPRFPPSFVQRLERSSSCLLVIVWSSFVAIS
jgi:hypothetical protein